ncbi:hypothetical protein SAY87_011762 [Trapa incisa]|uniref:Uncharacterized protein n=1 Tax=Trapa incisa TaxID=236973 RepID=A0AAN7JJA4_9MYRT|nr:hypothetical protein SAY87_011762 [Trapa incisa]
MVSSKHFSLILIVLFFVAYLAHARENQFFFSKVTDKDSNMNEDRYNTVSFNNRYLTEQDSYDGQNVVQSAVPGAGGGGSGGGGGGSNSPSESKGKYSNNNNNN